MTLSRNRVKFPLPMEVNNPNALKHMYGPEFLQRMARALKVFPKFDKKAFLALRSELLELEMKPRVLLVRDELRRQLPESFPAALKLLLAALKTGELKGFDLWPFTEYIQAFGLEYPEKSLNALKLLTVPFTGEFAVRPFLAQDPQATLAFLLKCAEDSDHRVRRWASEGSRPRLPWGQKLNRLIERPDLTLPILEKLKFDPEIFVRKSVANHLNDISKDHPALVLKVLKKWKAQAKGENQKRIEWIIRHALRTLIKAGHPEAMKLIGVDVDCRLGLSEFKLSRKKIALNDRLEFAFRLSTQQTRVHKVVVDYCLYFKKAQGEVSGKVFKLKTFEFVGKGELVIKKSHHLKEVTTRRHYPGTHYLEILVNGKPLKKVEWELVL